MLEKQQSPKWIPSDDNWGISTWLNSQISTLQNHWSNDMEVEFISFEGGQWRKICHSSFQSDSLRIVSVFLKMKGYSLIVARSSPPRALSPRSIDCSFGKSESSIHSFNHSQTQPIEHKRMHYQQVKRIQVEGDLWIQTNESTKPVNENDGTHQKQ